MGIDSERLETLHRLRWAEHWSVRKIARHLHMARRTVQKYLHSPLAPRRRSQRTSKLDPYKEALADLLRQDPTASCVVLRQRIASLGYRGGRSILDEYVRSQRQKLSAPRAFLRIEVEPGERFEVDWGHFGSLDYQGDKRKLYAFCLVECHSRRLYLEFTHSQGYETFARCHQHAFHFMGGVARQAAYDNLLSAVLEHDGKIVRFNPRFLAFAREYDFYPRACHVGAAWEKGKVERAGVGYVRQNFWPLRQFADLADVNRQARQWLAEVANQRLHRETRQSPDQRFRPDCLRPPPAADPDYRDTALAALERAQSSGAFGADYVANILRQQLSPRAPQPPLRLKDPWLNQLATDPLSLLDYDAFILNSSKEDS